MYLEYAYTFTLARCPFLKQMIAKAVSVIILLISIEAQASGARRPEQAAKGQHLGGLPDHRGSVRRQDGGGRRRLAQQGCDPPRPEQRLVAYGEYNFTHT